MLVVQLVQAHLIKVVQLNLLNQETLAHMDLVILAQMVILTLVVEEVLEVALVELVLVVVSVEVKVVLVKLILSLMEQHLYSMLVVVEEDKVLQVNKLMEQEDKVALVMVE